MRACVHMYACMRVCVRVPQWARQVGPGTSRLAGTLLPPQVFQEQPGPFLAEASTPAPSLDSSQPPSTSWTLSRGKFPASSRQVPEGAGMAQMQTVPCKSSGRYANRCCRRNFRGVSLLQPAPA